MPKRPRAARQPADVIGGRLLELPASPNEKLLSVGSSIYDHVLVEGTGLNAELIVVGSYAYQ